MTVSITKSSIRRGPRFVQSARGTGVRVSPGKGGVNIGTATHCESKRKAFQTSYGKGAY